LIGRLSFFFGFVICFLPSSKKSSNSSSRDLSLLRMDFEDMVEDLVWMDEFLDVKSDRDDLVLESDFITSLTKLINY